MRNPLRSLFGSRPAPPPAEMPYDSPLTPDAPFVAIGDLHGRVDLLDRLLERLAREDADCPWVFLGDYVDRGPDSAGVLARLRALQAEQPERVICIKGNHEKMVIDFLDDPAGRGMRFLQFGGIETLKSFGVDPRTRNITQEDTLDLCDAFRQALPEGLVDWLTDLPLSWSSGNVHCVHAAMDPERGLEGQESRTLMWGHPQFLTQTRDDGVWVVHGHTIMKAPQYSGGRISIDTGAYQTGRLTAARIGPDRCEFVTA